MAKDDESGENDSYDVGDDHQDVPKDDHQDVPKDDHEDMPEDDHQGMPADGDAKREEYLDEIDLMVIMARKLKISEDKLSLQEQFSLLMHKKIARMEAVTKALSTVGKTTHAALKNNTTGKANPENPKTYDLHKDKRKGKEEWTPRTIYPNIARYCKAKASDIAQFLYFSLTLSKSAEDWWKKLSPGLVQTGRSYRQCSRESLKKYIQHMMDTATKKVIDDMKMVALTLGITIGYLLWGELQRKRADSLSKFLSRAQGFINLEDAYAQAYGVLPAPSVNTFIAQT
uniref:Retrotransposon gag domain-containing protein n=1 Tax=Cannabis sativa TaxID=3483 RepID=A0A803QB74_CANSA